MPDFHQNLDFDQDDDWEQEDIWKEEPLEWNDPVAIIEEGNKAIKEQHLEEFNERERQNQPTTIPPDAFLLYDAIQLRIIATGLTLKELALKVDVPYKWLTEEPIPLIYNPKQKRFPHKKAEHQTKLLSFLGIWFNDSWGYTNQDNPTSKQQTYDECLKMKTVISTNPIIKAFVAYLKKNFIKQQEHNRLHNRKR